MASTSLAGVVFSISPKRGQTHRGYTMLNFRTEHPCPTSIISGGGEGRYGLCAMELVSILTGENEEMGRPYDKPPSVHGDLRSLLISANDFGNFSILPSTRTAALWPLLPSVIGTAGGVFPWKEYRQALGFEVDSDEEADYMPLGGTIRLYALKTSEGEGYEAAFEAAVEGLRIAITLFHEANGTTPLPDYLSIHLERLASYLEANKDNSLLFPSEEEVAA